MTSRSTSLPGPAALLSQRPPMLLLDEIVGWDGERVRCRTTVREDAPFVVGGRLRAAVTLEHMAQSVAVFEAMVASDRGQPVRPGAMRMIVAVPELKLERDHLAVGDELEVEAEREYGEGELGSFVARVRCRGQLVSEARLTVYRQRAG